jgi:hypothetical protein
MKKFKKKIAKIWRCNPDNVPDIASKEDYLTYLNDNKTLIKKLTANLNDLDYNIDMIEKIRPKSFYSVIDLSAFFDVKRETLSTWKIRQQNIPYYMLGEKIRYMGLDILNLVKYVFEVRKIKAKFLEDMMEN